MAVDCPSGRGYRGLVMNVVKATSLFEEWLGRRTDLIKKDLKVKHAGMKAGAFTFLRATYYRWAQVWPKLCPDLAKAPRVLAVGDLHIENFGTWRDIDGRLIWGVNDFDEACLIPYASDLVRLGVSAHFAVDAGNLELRHEDVCDAILEGYRDALRENGRPFVLSEQNKWLREIAEGELRDPARFWKKMDGFPTVKGEIPLSAVDALEHLLPGRGVPYRIVHRVAGLGSLGRARFVALADWRGGKICREAKAAVTSSSHWADGDDRPAEILYLTIVSRAVRCPDPFLKLHGRWIVRRLAPDCSRIELADLHSAGGELRLIHAMGWEAANIHLGTRGARKAILHHLNKKKGKWLHEATREMRKSVRSDWETWKKDGYS